MPISNVSNSNSVSSTKPNNGATAAVPTRKERPRADSGEAAVVNISSRARDLSQADRATIDQKQAIERIQDLNRTDTMAQEKMEVNAKADEKAIEAKQKIDEQLYKRINTYA